MCSKVGCHGVFVCYDFSFESTALRLITSLGSSGVQLQMSRVVSEPKSLVSSESEELNRVLVLTLARGIAMTGTGLCSQCVFTDGHYATNNYKQLLLCRAIIFGVTMLHKIE